MARKVSSVHVDTRPRTYTAKDGSVREYRQALLRRSFRNEEGKPSKETLANLSALPDEAIDAIRKVLAGKTLVDTEESFTIERSLLHGHVGAAHVMASKLRFVELLGPPCPERDIAYALILSRVAAPRSKLATTRWWNDTSLGHDLGITEVHSDAVYAAMDWLGPTGNDREKTRRTTSRIRRYSHVRLVERMV